MVAGTQPSQQHPLPTSMPTAEEEALKRNTDCVYFLASPLTCKKGSECEYRHSEYARVNPRDCWYWLNGNCLNPKCSFRHPPLDALLGTQVNSAGPSLPSSQTTTITATQASHTSGKQAFSCIFFQKGLCVKGDRCAFLHGPHPTSNKTPQVPAATPKAEPPTLKKPFGGLEKCTQEYKVPQAYKPKSIDVPVAKPASKAETVPLGNGVVSEKNLPEPTRFDNEYLRYKSSNVSPPYKGNSANRSNRSHQIHASADQGLQNSKDADEFLRESSPGFDVLVDDELGDTEYYHGEDQFRGGRVQEGKNLNAVNECDIGRSADYSPMVDVDQELFRDPRGYDSHDRINGQYAWEQHRASSERMSAPIHTERRGYAKVESRDHINESDLRHQLSKHRRVNGLRSVVSKDYSNDNLEERSYRGSSQISRHLARESSRSSRLTGRIKLPGRSSPVNDSDMRPEREMERGRNWGRMSPGRPHISSQQGRLQDRIKGRVQEDYRSEERTLRGPRMSREVTVEASADFDPPKSLSELKGVKTGEKEQQSLGKRKSMKIEDYQQGEDDLGFESPKPLSEILKRKRGTGVASSDVQTSLCNEENNQRDREENLIRTLNTTSVTENKTNLSVAPVADGNSHMNTNKEEPNSATADAVETRTYGHSSQVLNNANELEFEDGMIVEEGMEDQEYEAEDQKEGDYDYEQVDDGDYNYDEGENAYPEEEYLEEDEDGDDFAKKIGVVL